MIQNKLEWGKRETPWPDGWQKQCDTEFILSGAFFQAPATWVKPEVKVIFDPKTCPARCGRTGDCFAVVYFTHKSGKHVPCSGDLCPWRDRFEEK